MAKSSSEHLSFVRNPKTKNIHILNLPLATRILALVLACAAPVFAADGHDHAGHSHAAKITGPNKGRVLTELEPHAEFFVTAERKVRLTFVDDAGKPVAIPAGFTATLVTGDRAKPTTLQFAAEGEGAGATLLSTAALPEGQNLPAILRATPEAGAKAVTIRFQINLANCGECSRPEYACTCAH
jgi:hypothetical protein